MNNWTIGKKLIASFLAVAAITLLLGIVGYYGAVKSEEAVRRIGADCLPSVQGLLTVGENAERIKTAQRALLSPNISISDRKRQPKTADKAKAAADAAWKVYNQLPHDAQASAALSEFVMAWDQWEKDNEAFFKINGEYEAMVDFYSKHTKSENLSYSQATSQLVRTTANAEVAFKKQVQEWKNILLRGNDEAKYDKHFGSFAKEEKIVQEELIKVQALMQQLGMNAITADNVIQQHAALGTKYREALKRYDKANPDAARIVDKAVTGIDKPATEAMESIITTVTEAARKTDDVFVRMDNQLLTVCHDSETKALALLDKLVESNQTVAVDLTQSSVIQATTIKFTNLVVMIAGVVVALLLGILVSRGIVRPIRRAADMLKDISEGEGDLTKRLEVATKDEIGEMATSFNKFVEKLQGFVVGIVSNAKAVTTSVTELSTVATKTTQTVKSMSERTCTVAAAAEEASANTVSVAASMEQTSTNLASVAAATEEMSATVGEIAANSEKARVISGQATAQAKEISSLMQQLGIAAKEIDKVTESINRISAQTNLLALNATIEAASAGEAGRGFAVVANEIKELARQTATATENIKDKIAGVQASTNGAINGIEKISGVINDVGSIIVSIAAAIEEQSSVTKAVAGNIAQASIGVKEANVQIAQTASVSKSIANDLTGVNSAVDEIRQGGENVQASTMDLSKVAEQLKATSDQFKV